ncbi:MAG: rane protein [Microbacteriaceae bacterium]|jgi:CrcB protein|nr:rane protein [Microbacteriaceae bacterium]
MTAGRPAYLQWRNLGIVAVGGMVGTAIRELLSLVVPSVGGLPIAIFGINILGAFALGMLLEALARRGPDEGRLRTLRLLLGTGVLGGFTTYSALATDTSLLLVDGRVAAALIYSLASLIVGALSTWGGIAMAASLHRRREEGPRESEVAR